jgi:hypothetical protein
LDIQYQGGDATERWARIVSDPDDASNHVLQFVLKSPNVRDGEGLPSKGRVQLNAYSAESVRSREVRFSTRMRLSEGFSTLKAMPRSFNWLTISEWWNDPSWNNQEFPFRITVNIIKPDEQSGSPLRFSVHAQTLNQSTQIWDNTVWSFTALNAEVPIGRWVTLEYVFREGNALDGRFYMAVVTDEGSRTVLFDVSGWTHHPGDPDPDGLTHFNPLKLYTSKTLIDAARNAGGALEVLWDDLSLRLCRQPVPSDVSACGPESYY